jgi:protein gp37
MADNSAIEWTDATWNPIVGCTILSPGCINCYAQDEAARQIRCAGGTGRDTHYAGTVKTVKGKPVWTGKLAMAPDHILLAPLKRKKPTTYFVNSMGDLFHEDCPDRWIDRVFAVMALSPQHTFQVLTKRAQRMLDYFTKREFRDVHPLEVRHDAINAAMDDIAPAHWCRRELNDFSPEGLPLPNVWLGVSAERQQEADERIPLLLQTPAAIRFISAEPLLGPIDLTNIRIPLAGESYMTRSALQATDSLNLGAATPGRDRCLDWVIAGGESGPNARPMHPDWARALHDQCKAAGTAFFFKQWGEFHPSRDHDHAAASCQRTPEAIHISGKREFQPSEQFRLIGSNADGWAGMCRLGKARAGRQLDGKLHNAMPARGAAR